MLGFVIGTGRCGSTLIHEVLARHPAVGFVSNLDDKLPMLDLSGRWNNVLLRRAAPRDPRLGPFRDRPHLLERGPVARRPFGGLAGAGAAGIADPHGTPPRSGGRRRHPQAGGAPPLVLRAPHGGAGTTSIPAPCHRLAASWPAQRRLPPGSVHPRRPRRRAVANSWLQTSWWTGYQGPANWYLGPLPEPYAKEWETSGPSFVLLAGLGWKLLLDAFEAAHAAVPCGQWLEVRYEDVLADPRGQIAAIVEFLGLQWTSSFEAGFARYTFQTGRREAFRHDLDPENLALLEQSLAGHLQGYRYATATRPDEEGQRPDFGQTIRLGSRTD